MPCQRVFLNWVMGWVALPSLTMFLVVAPAIAQTSHSDYLLLVGSGFLCESGDSSACPAVVKSANGDSYEMSGAGTFTSQSKSVTAAGTFTHKSADGVVLETGVWTASELVSFDSYGIAPGALMREGRALGSPHLASMRSQNVLRPRGGGRPGRFPRPALADAGASENRHAASELCSRQGARRAPSGRDKAGFRGRQYRIQ